MAFEVGATVRLYSGTREGRPYQTGSALQIAPRRWVTASHAVSAEAAIKLKLGDAWSQARVIHRDEELDFALLVADKDWPWQARISMNFPDSGSPVKVTGWVIEDPHGNGPDRAFRVVQDYICQGSDEESLLVLKGAAPSIGFSGAAVTDVRTGKVVGIILGFRVSRRADGSPAEIDEAHARSLSCIPGEYW
ncbi:trypsin-like peptidase domain-containing protein [Streptomyces sp. NPDC051320]|uniref:trypsin-like peptidase domain-containing protein n=1 Tax=Streptomyces sp. NPDC051320 TaxID=3154644 RepID=UPI00342BB92E